MANASATMDLMVVGSGIRQMGNGLILLHASSTSVPGLGRRRACFRGLRVMTPLPMFRGESSHGCDGRNLFQIEAPTFRLETAWRPPRRAPFASVVTRE